MSLDFSAVEDSPKKGIDFPSVQTGNVDFSGLDEVEKQSDQEVVNSLPDTLKFALWDTGIPLSKAVTGAFAANPVTAPLAYLTKDSDSKDIGASLVGTGHMMTDVYRGVKQILGIDEDQMREEQKHMDKLYSDKDFGGYAIGGAVVGALSEPAGLLIPFGKAKSIASVGKIAAKETLKAIARASARGATVGATYGGLSYVNEGKGQTRLGNAVLGGTLGAILSGTLRGVGIGFYNKTVTNANQKIDDVERIWAQKLLEGKPTDVIRKEIVNEIPNLRMKDAQRLTGRRPRLVSRQEEAQDIVNFYNSSLPKQSDLSIGMDKVTGIVSTRVANASQSAGDRLRKYDSNVSIRTHENLSEANIWLSDYKKIPKSAKHEIDLALYNGEIVKAKALMKLHGGDQLVTEYSKVEKLLRNIGDELESSGRITKRDNYFPRYISDKDGLFNAIGRKERSVMESALDKARKSVVSRGYSLSPAEESDIINKALRGYPKETFKPGFYKQRGIEEIKKEWLSFYSPPEEALHSYIRNSITDLEKTKFFGRDIKFKTTGDTNVFDIDASVGEYVRKEFMQGKISRTQQKELENLLSVRFGIGERSPAGIVQDVKNIMYAGLLGNPLSAATQIGDLGISIYTNGFLRTLRTLPKALIGNAKISAKDLGLVDAMTETFATTRNTSKFMKSAMKWGIFQKIDRVGKDTLINSSLNKYKGWAKSAKGIEKIREKYGRVFGEDFDGFVSDLNNGRISENVKHFLFSEVADVQPISLSEVPEMYLRLPNGRITYMLKTFMLKQLDVVRREAYNNIKNGHKAKGLFNLMKFGIILGSANTGSKYVKDWMMGRDVEADLPADIGENFLKMFAYNEYLERKLEQGKVFEAATDIVTPPWQMFDKIAGSIKKNMAEEEADYAWSQYMPVWGRLWYELYGGGLEKYEQKQQEKEYQEANEE